MLQARHSITRGFLVALCLCSTPMVLQRVCTAAADGPVPATSAAIAQNQCRSMDPKRAHQRADLAFQKGEYQQAAQCYLIAGDKLRADRAFIKATAAQAPLVGRQLAANAKQVKEQFRQFREAFASH